MKTIRLVVALVLVIICVSALAAEKPTPEQCKKDPLKEGCQK